MHRERRPSRAIVRRSPSFLAVASALVPFLLFAAAATGASSLAQEEEHRHDPAAAAEKIAEALELGPDSVFADVGAGGGEWTVRLAEWIGPEGHVYATEVEPILLSELRERFEADGPEGATIVLGYEDQAGLPPSCCDAVLLRLVYHHLQQPEPVNRSLFEALRPGGLLAILENPPSSGSAAPGVPEDREGHGIDPEIVTREMTAAGFEPVRVEESEDYGHGIYLALYRRPDLEETLRTAWEEVDRANEATDPAPSAEEHPAPKWAARLWAFRDGASSEEAARATSEALHMLVHSSLEEELRARVADLPPEDTAWPGVLNVLAEHARRTADPSLALESAGRLLDELEGPAHLETRQRAAMISGLLLQEEGRKEEALASLEAAVEMDPDTREAETARSRIRDLTELAVGMPAPEFSAETLRGGQLSSGDLRGKIVLLDFWSTT